MDIAAIGLGQAGGNIAAEFYRRGYRALALNTAQTDLAALEPGGLVPDLPPDGRLYIGLDGYDGAGADPAYGRDCIREHADRIKAQVQKIAQDADAVIVCAGLGGGTGSALPTLVEVLEDDQLPLVGLMTLPSESESGLAKVNAVRTINEVTESNMLGWIFVDNGRLAALNPDVSLADYYAAVNAQVVDPLDALNGLNARDNVRPIRSFDGEDFRKLLLAGGVLNYGTAEILSVDVDEVVGSVRDCIAASDLMPAGFDIARVSYLGLILEAPEPALAATSIAGFERIHDALKRDTEGAAIYQGIYRSADATQVILRVVAVTQSLPERVRQLLMEAKQEGQALGAKVREELPGLDLGEVEDLDLFRTHARPSERPRRARGRAQPRRPAPPVDDLPVEVAGPKPNDRPLEPRRVPAPAPPPPAQEAPPAPTPPRRPTLPPDAPTVAATLPIPDEARREPTRVPRRAGGRRRPPPPAPMVADAEVPVSESIAAADIPATVPPMAHEPITEHPDLPQPRAGSELGTAEFNLVAEVAELTAFPDSDLNETVGGLRRPPPADPDADTGDLPSPAVYDKLVADYWAHDEDERLSVQQRLEQDSLSENSVVRYYAVDAMAKLGRTIFGNALLAATEDEDEAVRALAVQALNG